MAEVCSRWLGAFPSAGRRQAQPITRNAAERVSSGCPSIYDGLASSTGFKVGFQGRLTRGGELLADEISEFMRLDALGRDSNVVHGSLR
jgi:hypothetical protein